jgi:hypothetical protein
MKIAFMSSKGSASKTTYARLVSEYFSKNIKNRIENGYTEIEIKELEFLNTTKPVNIFSVTNHEVTLVRFAKQLGTIHEISSTDTSSFEGRLFNPSIENNDIAIYDFGADIHTILEEFSVTKKGIEFFTEIDYIFIPVKYDEDYVVSAAKIISKFKHNTNIKFIICLTDYYGDLKSEFNKFFTNQKILDSLYLLELTDRIKLITVPHSRFIRESNESVVTIAELKESLVDDEIKNECELFEKILADKFDYAFFNFDRNEPKFIDLFPTTSTNVREAPIPNIEELKALLLEVLVKKDATSDNDKPLNMVNNNNQKLEELKGYLQTEFEKLESLSKTISVFASPDIDVIFNEIKAKYQKNSLLIVSIFFLVFMLIPFGIFGIVGYRYGSAKKEVDARNKAEQQLLYANTFAKTLYETGALQSVSIHYDPIRNITSLVCDESLGKCLNRFDAENHISSIEFKGQSK